MDKWLVFGVSLYKEGIPVDIHNDFHRFLVSGGFTIGQLSNGNEGKEVDTYPRGASVRHHPHRALQLCSIAVASSRFTDGVFSMEFERTPFS